MAWGGGVVLHAFDDDATSLNGGLVLGPVGGAVLVFAAGMAGLGREQHEAEPTPAA